MLCVLARLLSTPAGHRIELRRRLRTRVDRAWHLVTDASARADWLMPGVLEPVLGGRVELRDDHHHVTGRVIRCEPPNLLAFTWSSTDAPAGEVWIRLVPHGEECELLLIHQVSRDGRVRSVAAGWHRLTDTLNLLAVAHCGDGSPAGPRPSYAQLVDLYARVDIEEAPELAVP